MTEKKYQCPYCEDSGVLVRHNHLQGTMFIRCPYCEKQKGVTITQLVALGIFTFLVAWGIAVVVTMMFN